MKDIRYALRVLTQSPGFTLIAILALALGIGANTAIFSVVSGVLLRPLSFSEPDRLIQIYETFKPNGWGSVSYPNLKDWRDQSTTFDALIGYSSVTRNLQDDSGAERVRGVASERGIFRLLGVTPLAGRLFRDDDPRDVAVVSEAFWKRRMASAAPGAKISLDGESFTVIGVVAESVQFPPDRTTRTEVYVPLDFPPTGQNSRENHYLAVTARLKPGATVEAARNEMGVIARRLELQYPGPNDGRAVRLTPLSEVVVGSSRTSLLVLLGAVGLVLLIACFNVANLLLARAAARSREVAIRSALGATRGRLIRQFLVESSVLSFAGAICGLLIAVWCTPLLLQLSDGQIPRAWEIGLDWRVFLFLLATCAITGIGFGLAPAIAASRDVERDLREGVNRGSAGRSTGRLRDVLVIAEVGISFVLLVGAGLLLRAFVQLQNTPSGLVTEKVLTMRVNISQARYGEATAAVNYYGEIQRRVSQLPGVREAAFVSLLPLQSWGWNGDFSIVGRPEEPSSRKPQAEFRTITPNYFRSMGIPIRQGRAFTERDTADAPPVVIINEALARQHFSGENPVGKFISRETKLEIVGVSADVRQAGLDRAALPEIFHPIAQRKSFVWLSGMTLIVGTQTAPENSVSAVREAIRQIDSTQAVFNVNSMDKVVANSLSNQNLYTWLLGLFAALALVLAVAGIYGVISYAVTRRTREFGIRIALGAPGARVLQMVLARGGVLVALGLVAGVAGAIALTRLLGTLLGRISATDPLTFAAVGLILALVALGACYVPARRATRVDPVVALRQE